MVKVLISGGGIAGLTIALLLKKIGYEPFIVERTSELRAEGYMMDFFGTGWDVAERIGLLSEFKKIQYPIETMEFVNAHGTPWCEVSMEKIRQAMGGAYTYLRRPDIEQILYREVVKSGIRIQYGTSITTLIERKNDIEVTLSDGTSQLFDFVVGADGIHSRVRELVFGPEETFARYLGYYVAAFHTRNTYGIGEHLANYQVPGRAALFYPLDKEHMDATYIFSSPPQNFLPLKDQHQLLRSTFASDGWIVNKVLQDLSIDTPVYFDAMTQIEMPQWSKGRVVLLGDACACLTLVSGQGAHMAMAEAYVLATELKRHGGNMAAAFTAYENVLRPSIEKKQKAAKNFSGFFFNVLPRLGPLYHALLKLSFHPWCISRTAQSMGSISVLKNYSGLT